MCKYLMIVSLIYFSIIEINCMPFGYNYNPVEIVPIGVIQPNTYTINQNRPKFVWNAVGNFISSSGFLPIEINVPSTLGAIYNGAQNAVSGLTTGISSITGNVIQRIPFLNRLTSAEKPRPLKTSVILLVPMDFVSGNNGNYLGETNNLEYTDNIHIFEVVH